ncbi:MAG: RidA family protein [Bacteroidetes bacterium]|nr:RidA family protein [Bacteroidota bacterium]
MQRIINTEGAPKPIGPYSQAVNFRRLIFTSGQVALNEHGVIATEDIKEQTRIVIENLRKILQAGGSSLFNVVKTTVFLKDMNDFAQMNEVYDEFFGKVLPARSTVEVARLPKDAKVEIEVIAFIN